MRKIVLTKISPEINSIIEYNSYDEASEAMENDILKITENKFPPITRNRALNLAFAEYCDKENNVLYYWIINETEKLESSGRNESEQRELAKKLNGLKMQIPRPVEDIICGD